MQFDGMTPEQAAVAVIDDGAYALLAKVGADEASLYALNQSEARIAAACQHFYERGRADAVKAYAFNRSIDPQADVREFMAAFGQALPSRPQWPDEKTMDLRVKLKAEEFCEWLRDSGYDHTIDITRLFGVEHISVFRSMEWESQRSLSKSADALIDDLYVTIGALAAMGIDMWPLWRQVHRANMAKRGGPVVDGKQMKPAGWTPPDIEALLRAQGWEGE